VPESVQIPIDLLAETRAALDAALSGSADARERAAKVKAKLEIVAGGGEVCSTMKRTELKKVRDELLTLARRLEKVERAA
jgi:hypothetical protein